MAEGAYLWLIGGIIMVEGHKNFFYEGIRRIFRSQEGLDGPSRPPRSAPDISDWLVPVNMYSISLCHMNSMIIDRRKNFIMKYHFSQQRVMLYLTLLFFHPLKLIWHNLYNIWCMKINCLIGRTTSCQY
jgi:hypothetical protein